MVVHAMTDLGGELLRLLAERDMSLRELARRTPCDPGNLSRIARGRKGISPALAARFDEVLGTDGSLTALASPACPGGTGPDGLERLAWASQHPRHAAAAIEPLAAVLAAQRREEDV